MFVSFEHINKNVDELVSFDVYGHVKSLSGSTIVSVGPDMAVGDLCSISSSEGDCLCEVIGFKGSDKILMPLDELKSVKANDKVYKLNRNLSLDISEDYMGCILNGIGEIVSDNGKPYKRADKCILYNKAPKPVDRVEINEVFPTGIKAIDGLLTFGFGQRVGIFAGSGVGKTTLIQNIISYNKADVNIVALIGERGKEMKDFIRTLGDDISKTIIVASTSDNSPLMRVKCAYTATSIAEHFRDKGLNVFLVMDSITRFAMAQRQIGLSAGEPPTAKAYPPSVFELLPKLLERAGKTDKGSITAVYSVLMDGDDDNDTIPDTVRGILDGHIILSRRLSDRNHYPAIDVLRSISRIMNDLTGKEHKMAISNVKKILDYCFQKEDQLNFVYKKGSDPNIDEILRLNSIITSFLQQQQDERRSFEESTEFIIRQFTNLDLRI